MAVFGQARLGDLQLRRRVLVDRPQQFEAALCALRITFLTVGAVAFQTIRSIDDQRLPIPGRALKVGSCKTC